MAIKREQLVERVRALGLPSGDYAVFGSGPLVVRGEAWEKATSLGTVGVAPEGGPVVRVGGDVEIFAGWMDLDADGIIDGAEPVEGVPFARLRDILAFKRSLGRPKDQEHIRLIEERLREGEPGARG